MNKLIPEHNNEPLNLYILQNTKKYCDNQIIVAASSEDEAKKIHPDYGYDGEITYINCIREYDTKPWYRVPYDKRCDSWGEIDDISVELIGKADKKYNQPTVVVKCY